jgi:hypothetical protein
MKETGLYLELKTAAIDIDPRDAIRQAVKVADRVGVCVHVGINNVLVCAYPDDDAELLVTEWESQLDRRAIQRIAVLWRARRNEQI